MADPYSFLCVTPVFWEEVHQGYSVAVLGSKLAFRLGATYVAWRKSLNEQIAHPQQLHTCYSDYLLS